MFFYFSKLFALFFFPYPLALTLFLILCFVMPPLAVRFWMRLGVAGLLLFSFQPFGVLLLSPLEKAYPKVSLDRAPPADAIVVLSGMIRMPSSMEGEPEFTGSVDRILAAERLLVLKKATRLLISGGSSLINPRGVPEALILQRWLEQRQHAKSQMILSETASRNTAESAAAVARIAKQNQWKKIILVTSAYHIPRSMACFRRVKLKIIPIPVDFQNPPYFSWPEAAVPSLSALRLSTLALREYVGLVLYKLSGRI